MQVQFITPEQRKQFITDCQEAFQKNYEDRFGKLNEKLLTDEVIEQGLDEPNFHTVVVMDQGEMIGGAIIALTNGNMVASILLLYTKVEHQNKGVATFLYHQLEASAKKAIMWETKSPYCDVRYIHLFVNKLKFFITQFDHERYHPTGSYLFDDNIDPLLNGYFILRKYLNPTHT